MDNNNYEDKYLSKFYQEAIKEYNLPDYEDENYRRFVAECYDAGFPITHYDGRNFYHGPAVIVDDVQSVIRATQVKVLWDNMGLDWVVYPR